MNTIKIKNKAVSKKVIYILLTVTLSLTKGASAQGELNNNPPSNPAQIQLDNVNDNNVNKISNPPQANDDKQIQKQGDSTGKDSKPYCKECEEIKKLKQQQMAAHSGSGVTSGNGKTKHSYFKKFCVRTSKKWNRIFTHKKKIKVDYSCFNW